jgi:hypothetical protein
MAKSGSIMQEHGKKFIGVAIIAVSLIAAIGLVGQADNTVAMWGAKYSLTSGAAINVGDLEVVKVSLGSEAPRYFSNKAALVGSFLTKNVSQGELIPVSAVSKKSDSPIQKQVPLGISKSDLPSDLHIGDIVDLYSIPIKNPNSNTNLIVDKVRVVSIDSQSQNMGGVVNLLISVDEKVLLDITDAVQMGRIVVVRNAI